MNRQPTTDAHNVAGADLLEVALPETPNAPSRHPRGDLLAHRAELMPSQVVFLDGGRLAGATTAVFDDCFHFDCDFPISTFKHCNRKANIVAHELG